MLNKVVLNSTKFEFLSIISILSILTFYYGFFWAGEINPGGYNLFQFIFLYFIGRYIALHTQINSNISFKRNLALIYVFSSICVFGIVLAIFYSPLNISWIIKWGYAYNSPFIVISSIAFFLLFRGIKISSQYVNNLAISTLAIYIIHENPNISPKLYTFINEISKAIPSQWLLMLIFPIFALIIMFICIYIDKLRILATTPIQNKLSSINWDNKIEKLFDFITKRKINS